MKASFIYKEIKENGYTSDFDGLSVIEKSVLGRDKEKMSNELDNDNLSALDRRTEKGTVRTSVKSNTERRRLPKGFTLGQEEFASSGRNNIDDDDEYNEEQSDDMLEVTEHVTRT